MSACSRIDPRDMREAVECLLDESAGELMELLVSFIESVLASSTRMATLAARALIAERADHTFVLTPLGQALSELDRPDLLQKAADTILADIRREVQRPKFLEVERAKEN